MDRREQFTRLTLESSYGSKTIVEFDNEDIDVYELVNAFFTCLIGATFQPTSILRTMKEFAEDSLEVLEPDKEEKHGED